MSKQTAVEWIQHQVKQQGITHYFSLREILEQAIKMEKEQIKEAFEDGNEQSFICKEGIEYYNETYKKEEKC
jgi:hypothetical protein